MTALVETKNLKKHYQMGDTVVRGLDGVSIGVVEREFVALLGTSGSGKSTPLNFRLRVSITTSGSLRIDGSDIAGLSAEGLSRHRRQTVGIIFQSVNLISTMNAVEIGKPSPIRFSRFAGIFRPLETPEHALFQSGH